jgi:hypothetical protein
MVTVFRNIEMASHCFRASRPITMQGAARLRTHMKLIPWLMFLRAKETNNTFDIYFELYMSNLK